MRLLKVAIELFPLYITSYAKPLDDSEFSDGRADRAVVLVLLQIVRNYSREAGASIQSTCIMECIQLLIKSKECLMGNAEIVFKAIGDLLAIETLPKGVQYAVLREVDSFLCENPFQWYVYSSVLYVSDDAMIILTRSSFPMLTTAKQSLKLTESKAVSLLNCFLNRPNNVIAGYA